MYLHTGFICILIVDDNHVVATISLPKSQSCGETFSHSVDIPVLQTRTGLYWCCTNVKCPKAATRPQYVPYMQAPHLADNY